MFFEYTGNIHKHEAQQIFKHLAVLGKLILCFPQFCSMTGTTAPHHIVFSSDNPLTDSMYGTLSPI